MAITTGVGVFGPTSTDARTEYLKRMQAMYSSAQSPYERMGMALANIAGTALGVRDPALEQASKVQSIYNAVAQMHPDQTTPAFYAELASTFAAAGLSEQAQMSANKAREADISQRKMSFEERRVAATEAQVAQGEKRISLDKERLEADIAKEARLGRLTEAQIREVNARIGELGPSYDIQAVKGPAGETLSYVAINKKNPSDVKNIDLSSQSPAPPTPTSAANDPAAQARAELERRRNAR